MNPRRLFTIGSLAVVLILLTIGQSSAQGPTHTPLLTSPKQEYWPTANARFLAWAQTATANSYHYDVYAKSRQGGHAWKVNQQSTWGWSPSAIQATTWIVYQQADRNRTNSDIYMSNLAVRNHTKLPGKVNTKNWEYSPTASENFVLFSRYTEAIRTLLLYNRKSGSVRTIASADKDGDVRGTWVGRSSLVYQKCSPTTYACAVFYWKNGVSSQVPGQSAPWSQFYGALDEQSGDLYYVRSTTYYGLFAEVRRWNVSSRLTPVVVYDFDEGIDAGALSLAPNPSHGLDIVYAEYDCIAENWDIYQLTSVDQVAGVPGTSGSSPGGATPVAQTDAVPAPEIDAAGPGR